MVLLPVSLGAAAQFARGICGDDGMGSEACQARGWGKAISEDGTNVAFVLLLKSIDRVVLGSFRAVTAEALTLKAELVDV
jgi:hypothetical protein